MTSNQEQRAFLISRSRKLFEIADNLKQQSEALFCKADELKKAMRATQDRLRKRGQELPLPIHALTTTA